ncbi:MAG TPA: DsbA family protein [Solirubrobacteraceae bacterium]|nr:DsbA family protein [Solirubrobacteraceae bacterium]
MTSDLREEGARRDSLLPRGARHMQATPEASPLEIELFTDPACPFAFSAEPIRQRLRWHYGAGLKWTVRMIVLTREPGEAEKLAGGAPGLQRRYGMPIDPRPYPRPASSEPACLAFVAARRHAPQRAQALLRRLRVRVMQRGLLDDPALIDAAARDAGLDPSRLRAWCAEPETLVALEADAAAARSPSPAARALGHKLGGPARERRYTAPSYIIGGFALPGLNPVETYEAAIANLAPDLPRRPPPESVLDVLEWSDEPLASAELALIVGLEPDQVRADLRGVARFEPAGADGYWSL